MGEGSDRERVSQRISRNFRRGMNMIGSAGPRLLQWLSDTSRRGFSRLRGLETRDKIGMAALFVSILGLFGVGFNIFYTHMRVELTAQSLKQHLDPEVDCALGNIRDHFPLFSVVNRGQITAESVSVDHVTLRYEKKGEKIGQIRMAGYGADATTFPSSQLARPGAQWVYAPKLEANEHTPSKQTGNFVPSSPYNKELIAILFFKVAYLRPTDGKRYEKRCFFYKEGDYPYQSCTSFRSNPHFDTMNAEIDRFLEKNIFGMEGLYLDELRD